MYACSVIQFGAPPMINDITFLVCLIKLSSVSLLATSTVNERRAVVTVTVQIHDLKSIICYAIALLLNLVNHSTSTSQLIYILQIQ